MMNADDIRRKCELVIGLAVVITATYAFCLSVYITQNGRYAQDAYELHAIFPNANGIRKGSSIMIAGVEIGRVKQIALQDYEANITLAIQPGVFLRKDAIASVKSKGVIGEKYIEIIPGADNQKIPAGGRLRDAQSAMDLEGLVSKLVHGNLKQAPKEK